MATKSSGINGALAIPRAAIGFVSRLASGFFSRGQKQADSPNSDSRSEDEIQNQGWDRRMSSSNDTCYQSSGSMDNSGALSTTGKGGDCVAEVTDLTEVAEALISLKGEPENVSLQREDGTYVFKCFDITEDPHDHYFLGTSAQVCCTVLTGLLFCLFIEYLKEICTQIFLLYNNLVQDLEPCYSFSAKYFLQKSPAPTKAILEPKPNKSLFTGVSVQEK